MKLKKKFYESKMVVVYNKMTYITDINNVKNGAAIDPKLCEAIVIK